MSNEVKGLENSRPIKMIDIETKEATVFKSIAYAKRVTGLTEYALRASLNPLLKKRFIINNKTVCFRVIK